MKKILLFWNYYIMLYSTRKCPIFLLFYYELLVIQLY